MTRSLTERIRQQTTEAEEEARRHTDWILEQHGNAVMSIVTREKSLIEKSIKDLRPLLTTQRQWIWLTFGACLTILFISSISVYSLNSYLGRQIIERSSQVEALNQTLDRIKNIRGFEILETDQGSFLVLPGPTTHICHNEQPCIQINR